MKLVKRKDVFILILGLLLAGALALIWYFGVLGVGEKVIVSYNGEVVNEYDLHGSGVYELVFPEGRNVLTISGGKASVTDADCPDPRRLPVWFKQYPIVLIDRDRIYPKDKSYIKSVVIR